MVDKWHDISIGWNNSSLTSATIYYFSADYPFDDNTDDNYWHYNDNGKPEIWVKKED